MSMRRVERIALDGSTVTMAFGRSQIQCIKANYGDKIETTTLTNMGGQQIDARTRGTYVPADGKITMESVIFRTEFLPLLQEDGFGNEQIPVTIGYSHPDLGDDSDLLSQTRFIDLAAAIENSNKAFEVEFGIVYNQVFWGEDRKTINQLDPSVPLGSSKF